MSEETTLAATPKRRTGRSPAYPFISVKKALEQAKALLDQEGEYSAPLSSAMTAWGYGTKSSGGRQTLATMKYYGLIDISGDGDARKVKVSDIARRILLDRREDDSERRSLIRRVALTPAAHKAIFENYPSRLASDGSVHHFLMFDLSFKPDAATDLLAEFKETAAFAGLYQSAISVDKEDDIRDNGRTGDELPTVKAGDRIQWTNDGSERFKAPATVLGLSDDGLWVFTDQGNAAIPIKEVTVVNDPNPNLPDAKPPPPPPPHILAAMNARANALDPDESILTRGKLQAGSFEVRVKGEIGVKEIGKIVKMLLAQKAILSDEEDDEEGS